MRRRAAIAPANGEESGAADRRSRILAAAARRFAELGFEATTVRQIADDVSMLSGSLYHHFATKDDMLHAVVRDAAFKLRDNVCRIAAAPLDAEQRLIALVLLDLGELTRNRTAHAILTNERRFFRRNPDFAYVVDAKRETYGAWRTVLQAGMDAGLFRPDLDIYLTILTIFHMLSMAADWYISKDVFMSGQAEPYSLDAVIGHHLRFILSAVRTPERASAPIPRKACESLAAFQA